MYIDHAISTTEQNGEQQKNIRTIRNQPNQRKNEGMWAAYTDRNLRWERIFFWVYTVYTVYTNMTEPFHYFDINVKSLQMNYSVG